jgi:hypothetical protein
MFGLKNSNSSLRVRNRSDDGGNNVEWTEGARKKKYSSPADGNSISSTPLANAKRVIASRSRWIQQKKRKPEMKREEEEDTSHIQQGIENIRMTAEQGFSPNNNSHIELAETAILPPLPPPRSCTPTTEDETRCSWDHAPLSASVSVGILDATVISHTCTPGSWSASRAPPMKSW